MKISIYNLEKIGYVIQYHVKKINLNLTIKLLY